MTTTPPTWAELHAMVPECRPATIIKCRRLVHEEYELVGQDLDALCGFAAVEWLREYFIRMFPQDPNDPEEGAFVEVYLWGHDDADEEGYVTFNGPTLDAALRAAVAAVAGEGK